VSGADLCGTRSSGDLNKDIRNFQHPLLLYNQDRRLCYTMSKDCPLYSNIVKEIIKNGVGGEKGYFSAIKEDNDLKINYARIQNPEPW